SSAIQSDVAWRAALRPWTVPAIWMAPPNSSSFSVSVVLPASGCEMMAKVLLFLISPLLGSAVIAIARQDKDAYWDTDSRVIWITLVECQPYYRTCGIPAELGQRAKP